MKKIRKHFTNDLFSLMNRHYYYQSKKFKHKSQAFKKKKKNHETLLRGQEGNIYFFKY